MVPSIFGVAPVAFSAMKVFPEMAEGYGLPTKFQLSSTLVAWVLPPPTAVYGAPVYVPLLIGGLMIPLLGCPTNSAVCGGIGLGGVARPLMIYPFPMAMVPVAGIHVPLWTPSTVGFHSQRSSEAAVLMSATLKLSTGEDQYT